LFLGDSQGLALAYYGSDALDASGVRYRYKPIVGCGVFDVTEHVGGNCAGRKQMWEKQIRSFNPDLSVLMIGAWETLDFRRDGHIYEHSTPEHERVLERIVSRAIHPLTTRHGKIALLEVPCFGANQGDDADTNRARNAPGAVANVNAALRAVAARLPTRVTFVPWAGAICPDGKFTQKINGITVRPDGVHVGTIPGAHVITDLIAAPISDLARRARAAREGRGN
jgi:hypothetical protein